MKKGKKKSRLAGVLRAFLIGFVLLAGIFMMAYPLIAELVFEYRKDSVIETYKADSEDLKDEEMQYELNRAMEYNENLFKSDLKIDEREEESEEEGQESEKLYDSLLNIQENGLMGYIRIPCIDVELPIYHGVSELILQNGVGHLEGSSLPVGGENTHAVLTGHTGINRAKLFTDLTELEEGDLFYLYVLDLKMAYEVDQIEVVLPEEAEHLEIEPGRDLCTLVTCTPYGINSHRLLVRGHRVEYREEEAEAVAETAVKEKKESEWLGQYKTALLYGIGIIVFMVLLDRVIRFFQKRRSQKKKREEKRRNDFE